MLATPIENTRERLYEVMRALGPGWHDRAEIAEAIGKNYLNPQHVDALDLLVSDGRLEKVSQPMPPRNFSRWLYRVLDTSDEPFTLTAAQAANELHISPDKFKALADTAALRFEHARSGARLYRASDVAKLKGRE